MASEGDPTKSGYLTFDSGGMFTINRRILDKYSDSNKYYKGEPNKNTKLILEVPKDTHPDNFQVKVPS